MNTERRAGVEKPRRLFGRELHRFCRPARSRSCREVLPRRYDASTGYVNALYEKVVEKEKIDLVLERTSGVVHFDPSLDITTKVLDLVNKEKAGGK